MEYVLETNGLSKRYRDFTALNGLNMHIPKGSIYGFVGRNGAGKTTLIRLICGLQEPTSGSFTLYGAKNTGAKIERARRRMQQEIVYLQQQMAFLKNLCGSRKARIRIPEHGR